MIWLIARYALSPKVAVKEWVMLRQVSVEALKKDRLSEAWALARSSGSYANEDWWIAESADLIAGGGGILAARAADGRLHGVATFQGPRRPNEETLVVPMLVTFELSRSAPARNALLNSLKRVATKLECTHVLLPLSGKHELRQEVRDYD
jgi:hypothetical protein